MPNLRPCFLPLNLSVVAFSPCLTLLSTPPFWSIMF